MKTLRNVIIHHHIYKNAGSTIAHILDKNFGSAFADIHGSDANGIVTRYDLKAFLANADGIRAITSHHFHTRKFLPYDAPKFSGDMTLIDLVLIRHPISRLVSMYEFHRRGGGGDDEQTQQAVELGLRGWLEMLLETQPNMVNDVQVGVLSRLGYYASPPGRRDLKIARRKLRDFALVGTVERFDEFCVCAEYFLQPAFGQLDFTYQIQNANGPPERVSDVTMMERAIGLPLLTELIGVNSLDIELWKCAGQELDRRLTAVYCFPAKLDAFRARLGGHSPKDADEQSIASATPESMRLAG